MNPRNPTEIALTVHAEDLATLTLMSEFASILAELQDHHDIPDRMTATVTVSIQRRRFTGFSSQACVFRSTHDLLLAPQVSHGDSTKLVAPIESRVSWYPSGTERITPNREVGDGLP